ncbi:MAG: hypothetical protein IPP97_13375 [Candidatus Obscuribacter sp.]|jgi:hypothetical protein|nr:hypothetical protein [Candidatus Obscuribacter sp.]MBL0186723.1 hypothetical protein [Candidatus Obscuribacter sp.]MBP6349731.1 hypothetical protein [Candidatus Obscuribacter sp.]MBP6593064.1 hypothetical protein [Candidatus Obscuribacter sp.]MBP7578707.1 hypothetical protein [Candidatus Obscuribacter sp.]
MRYLLASVKGNFSLALLLLCLFCVLFQSSGSAKQPLELPERFRDYISNYERHADYIHPVLAVKAGTSVLEKPVSDRMLQKLNRYRAPKDFPHEVGLGWSNYFSRCEAEAAWILCNRVLGLTKRQVRDVVGAPTYVFSKAKGAPLESNHEFWMYGIGSDWIVIVLEFDGDKCLKADDCKIVWGLERYWLLVDWRLRKLSQFAIGKTKLEILKELNTPVMSRFDYGDRVGVLRYFLTRGRGFDFHFKDGKCVKAEELFVVS